MPVQQLKIDTSTSAKRGINSVLSGFLYIDRVFKPDPELPQPHYQPPVNHRCYDYFCPATDLAIFTTAHSPLVHHAHLSSLHNPGVPSSLTGAIGHVFLISGAPMMCLPFFKIPI
jgi:hypothetical protein